MRASLLFWTALAGIAVAVLYKTSNEVQEAQQKLAATRRAITAEQEAIRVLDAEWAWLTRPERLEDLATRHLGMGPTLGLQFASLQDLPEPLPSQPLPGMEMPIPRHKPLPPPGTMILAGLGGNQ